MKTPRKKTCLLLLSSCILLLTGCQGKDTLIYDSTRIDSFTMEFYQNSQLMGKAVVTDVTVISTFIARYEVVAVWTIPANDTDPNININYAHDYMKIYSIDVHLAAKGIFQTESTFWMEFGYNDSVPAYRFVTFSGYEYRYTNDYQDSEKVYLDEVYATYVSLT